MEAGITTDVAGNPNTAASQVLKYRPPSSAVSAVSKTANAVVAGSVAASLAASVLAGMSWQPYLTWTMLAMVKNTVCLSLQRMPVQKTSPDQTALFGCSAFDRCMGLHFQGL